MKKLVLAAALILIPQVAFAQSMNAQRFYERATSLEGRGMLAIFSAGEIKALTAEAKAAGQRARQQRLATVAAGKAPRYCPPEGAVSIGNTEFMSRLSAIPAAERSRIDMTEAMTRILTAKFPCRA